MADSNISTDTQVLHFQSQSPESAREKKNVIIDKLFEDTELLDDAVSLDGSSDGTPLVTHDFDTEVVDDTDYFEDVGLPQQVDEPEKEVVLDSEDEGNSDAIPERRIQRNVSGLQTMQPDSTFLRLDDLTKAFDGSVADEQCDTEALIINESPDAGNIYPQMLAHDLAEWNYRSFEEAKESSQTNALDFVNNYLALNNMESSPGSKPRNVARKIVSPVSRIKGCQTLAKQIKSRSAVGRVRTFEWDDHDRFAGIDFFGKRAGTTFDLGDSLESPVTMDHKAGHVDFKEGSNTNNKREDYCIDLNKEVTGSPSDPKAAVDRPGALYHSEQASETNFKLDRNSNKLLQLGLDSGAYGIEENASNIFDVGLGTQMAAEAMEALSYGLPTHNCSEKASQCSQNFLSDPSLDIAKSKIYFTKACSEKSAFSNPEGTSRMSKQKVNHASLPWRPSNYQEFNNRLKLTATKKRSKRFAGRLNRIDSACQNKYSDDEPAIPGKKSTEEGARGKGNAKKCEDSGSSSIPFETVILGKRCVDGEPVTRQIGHWTIEGKLAGKRDGPDNLGESINNTAKGSIVTYKRKRSSLGAKPSECLNVRVKCIDLEPFANQRHGTTGGELEGAKDVPDSLGEGKNAMKNVNIITYKRKKSVKVYERINPEEKHIRPTQRKQCSAEVSSSSSSLNLNAWNCPKGKRMPRRRPSDLNEAKNRSTAFMINDEKEGYKKPYNKILPKSSLLKELIRLGIQEPKSYFTWKDLRKRRDPSDVQVLFSQHLDNDVIKQQKKILARLGISIASCSKNATHFIADKFVRTRNMLEAMALGKLVVTHLWLESCGQASCLIDEKNYILRDAKKEKEIGFNMISSLARATRHPLLKGRRVLITPNMKPEIEMIAALVKSAQGEVVKGVQISSRRISDDLLILSCEEDRSICAPFLEKGAAVYSSELLLNGIVIQKLEYERHQLFTNRAKRNRRSSTR